MHSLSISVLDADFSNEKEWIRLLEKADVEYLHWDIMDGVYVPKKTFQADFVKEFKGKTKIPFDVHLMVQQPDKYFLDYQDVADALTFHPECCNKPGKLIDDLKDNGIMAGLAINNTVEVEKVLPFIEDIDLVLVMSVEAGLGGQKFNPPALHKIKFLRDIIHHRHLKCKVEVDGGITDQTAPLCIQAGTDILVSGSYVFKSKNLHEAIDKLRFF